MKLTCIKLMWIGIFMGFLSVCIAAYEYEIPVVGGTPVDIMKKESYCMASCDSVKMLEKRVAHLEEALHDIKDIFHEFAWQAFTYPQGVSMQQAFVQKYEK